MEEKMNEMICDASVNVVIFALDEVNKIIDRSDGMSMRCMMSLVQAICGQLIGIGLIRVGLKVGSKEYKKELMSVMRNFGNSTVSLSKDEVAMDALVGMVRAFDKGGK